MPSPGAFNDFAHVRKLGRPGKFLANLVACRHEHGRIAGAAGRGVRTYRSTGYLPCRIDDFFDGKTFAVTQIVKAAAAVKRAQSQDVRLRKINDMDIIAHARPVAGRVIISKNGNLFAFSERDLQNERDEVKLRAVLLPCCAICAARTVRARR